MPNHLGDSPPLIRLGVPLMRLPIRQILPCQLRIPNHEQVLRVELLRIAHNKVVVIDGATVLTGSFNFTRERVGPTFDNAPDRPAVIVNCRADPFMVVAGLAARFKNAFLAFWTGRHGGFKLSLVQEPNALDPLPTPPLHLPHVSTFLWMEGKFMKKRRKPQPAEQPPSASAALLSYKVLVRLLEIDAQHDQIIEGLEAFGLDLEPLRIDLLTVVLDALGVPPDNTVELTEKHGHKQMLEHHDLCCHDYLTDRWYAAKRSKNEIRAYLLWVQEELAKHSN